MVLAILGAAGQPWIEQIRNFVWAWQPLLANVIALFSLSISLLALRRTGRHDIRSVLRGRILDQVKKIRELSEAIAKLVEENLTGDVSEHSLKDSQKAVGVNGKSLEILFHELQQTLPSHEQEIYRAHNQWKTALTGDGFPVAKKADAFKLGDGRVSQVQVAQIALCSFLRGIEDGCIRSEIQFWRG